MNTLSVNVTDLSTTSRSTGLPAPATPSPVSAVESLGVHKEVGFEILERARSHHRKLGEVPYPLRLNNQNLNFDAIDHILTSELGGGVSLQKLDVPPRRVLDLGCGGGMWIVAAAQVWTQTTFVGFDIHSHQPNLSLLAGQSDLTKRIHWVHGNFLELLPFSDAEFDLVRAQNIGLGVPEDEWQNVIDEVVRVLKPGGSLEMIEEDILFPCPDTPITRTPRASPTLRGRLSHIHSQTPHDTEFTDDEKSIQDYYEDLFDPQKSRSVDTISGELDQRDHSKLKEAFMQMLSTRFINPQVLTVLPFYLQAAFQEVQYLPVMRLFLPPPSGVTYNPDSSSDTDNSSSSQLSLDSSSSATLVDSASSKSNCSSPTTFRRFFQNDSDKGKVKTEQESSLLTRMHLSRTLELIRGCKEAIWVEYEKIHTQERNNPNSRLDRDDFEEYFHNWECDMQDRCGMRDLIQTGLGWPLPSMLPKPAWRDWREKGDNEDVDSFYTSAPPEMLRQMRGFVCKTPVHIIRTDRGL